MVELSILYDSAMSYSANQIMIKGSNFISMISFHDYRRLRELGKPMTEEIESQFNKREL